jgi:hypothetical protein
MSTYEALTIVTLVTSTITMVITCLALLPQVKQGMVIVRDAVLWAAMVVLLVVIASVGWARVVNQWKRPLPPQGPGAVERMQAQLDR